jgi:hypothetical protein
MGRIACLAGDADAAGDAELDFVIVCATSDKEKSRGAVTAAAIKETLDFMDFGLVNGESVTEICKAKCGLPSRSSRR